jgi:hypothetical protein
MDRIEKPVKYYSHDQIAQHCAWCEHVLPAREAFCEAYCDIALLLRPIVPLLCLYEVQLLRRMTMSLPAPLPIHNYDDCTSGPGAGRWLTEGMMQKGAGSVICMTFLAAESKMSSSQQPSGIRSEQQLSTTNGMHLLIC